MTYRKGYDPDYQCGQNGGSQMDELAENAYQIAGAMLKARMK